MNWSGSWTWYRDADSPIEPNAGRTPESSGDQAIVTLSEKGRKTKWHWALQAAPLMGFYLQHSLPHPQVLVPDTTGVTALVSQSLATAVRAAYWPGVSRRYVHHSTLLLDPGNLVTGQTQDGF